MVDLVHTDAVFRVEPNTTPDYDSGNSLVKLLDILESASLGADCRRRFRARMAASVLVIEIPIPVGVAASAKPLSASNKQTAIHLVNVLANIASFKVPTLPILEPVLD